MMMTRSTKLLDVLHVMTRQHRDNSVLLVVKTKELADTFLTNNVETDRRLIEEENARLVNEGGDKFHLHPFA